MRDNMLDKHGLLTFLLQSSWDTYSWEIIDRQKKQHYTLKPQSLTHHLFVSITPSASGLSD